MTDENRKNMMKGLMLIACACCKNCYEDLESCKDCPFERFCHKEMTPCDWFIQLVAKEE